jgi:hypothetical protein
MNHRKFADIKLAKDDHDAGEIWGGAHWELGTIIGHDAAVRELLRAWDNIGRSLSAGLQPGTEASSFIKDLQATESSDVRDSVRAVFSSRGFPVG